MNSSSPTAPELASRASSSSPARRRRARARTAGSAWPERLEDEELRERVRQVLLGADDVGDLHLGVVDDAGEVVERRAVGPDDHEVADLVGLLLDVPLDQVVDDERAAERDLEPQGVGPSLGLEPGQVGVGERLAAEAVGALAASRPRPCRRRARPRCCSRDRRAPRRPARSAAGGVAVGALRLEIRAVRPADLGAFVPVHAHPAEAVEDQRDGLLDVPLLVGVVDPEDELAAGVAGQQPVEQRRPHPADVEEAGRAGGESCAYAHDLGSRAG